MAPFQILALGGDGIGPEVVAAGLRLLEAVADRHGVSLEVRQELLHGACYDAHGCFIQDTTLAAAHDADAVLVGAVGGPKWDSIRMPGGAEMQDGLMRLRKALDVYAGLRPAKALPCLSPQTAYRPDKLAGADVMVLREMCGGAFFAEPRGLQLQGDRYGFDTARYSEAEVARLAHAGFALARQRRGRLISADKANVMESCALWRQVVGEVAQQYPDVQFAHYYADNAAFQMVNDPSQFDVIIADNLFGDLLSDLAGSYQGTLGLLPSACLQGVPAAGQRVKGIYEPVHGSAPDIAGRGVANPVAMLLTVAMLCRYSLALPQAEADITRAVEGVLAEGLRTPDLGGEASTQGFTDAVIQAYLRL